MFIHPHRSQRTLYPLVHLVNRQAKQRGESKAHVNGKGFIVEVVLPSSSSRVINWGIAVLLFVLRLALLSFLIPLVESASLSVAEGLGGMVPVLMMGMFIFGLE